MDGAEDHELLEARRWGGGDNVVGVGLGGGGFVGFTVGWIGARGGGVAESEAAHQLAELLGRWTKRTFFCGFFRIVFGFGGVWCGNVGNISRAGFYRLLPAWWRRRVEG